MPLLHDLLGGVGRAALAGLRAVGGVAYLLWDAGLSLLLPREATRWRESAQQAVRLGVNAFPICALVLLFIGLILGLQMAYVMRVLGGGAQIFVPRVISVSIIRELGPLLCAIVMTGRMGAAIAAELGSMVVNEEIMALETGALSPIRFLVVPRMLAAVIMVPALTILSNFVGIFGGGVVCVAEFNMSWNSFSNEALHALVVKDVVTGAIKPIAFALVMVSIACHAGLNVTGGAEGVGKATTSAVVWSIVSIIAADVVCTWVFYYLFQA